MYLLTSPRWRLWLDPAEGVRWCALQAYHQGEWLHVMPDCRGTEAEDAGPAAGLLGAASFLMLPYSNRIRDAQFHFEGHKFQLADAERHAMHGPLRKLPWQVIDTSDTRLVCHFDSQVYESNVKASVNWPWPLEATVAHVLEEQTLTSTVTLTNRGSTNMPVGLGWHPYFLRTIKGATPELTLPVDAVFPDTSGDCLPDGAAVPLPDELDFRASRAIDPNQAIDHCFSGLAGDIRLAWPGAGLILSLRASNVCRFAVLYNPDQPYFAVEPVSNANDAFNLEPQGIDAGQHVLQPDESLEATLVVALAA